MPSTKGLKDLREALERQLAETRSQIERDRAIEADERGLDKTFEVIDPGEESFETEASETGAALSSMHVKKARQIEAALHRLAEGRYGRCVDCDEEIDPARLLAHPQCNRCLPCQRIHEDAGAGKARSPH